MICQSHPPSTTAIRSPVRRVVTLSQLFQSFNLIQLLFHFLFHSLYRIPYRVDRRSFAGRNSLVDSLQRKSTPSLPHNRGINQSCMRSESYRRTGGTPARVRRTAHLSVTPTHPVASSRQPLSPRRPRLPRACARPRPPCGGRRDVAPLGREGPQRGASYLTAHSPIRPLAHSTCSLHRSTFHVRAISLRPKASTRKS